MDDQTTALIIVAVLLAIGIGFGVGMYFSNSQVKRREKIIITRNPQGLIDGIIES